MTRWQLSDADRKEVVKYRLEKANRTYQEAVGSIKNGYVETAANRLYYAAYYAVSALLISYTYEVSTHNGVIQMFGKVFLRNNIIDKRYGKIFNQLFSLRLTGDYEDRHILDMETEVLPLVEPAKELIDLVSEMTKKVMWLQKKHTLQYSAVVSKEQPFILKGAFGLYFFTSSSSIIFPTEHLAIILPRYNSCHQEPIICVREIASVD